jgi:hypothetical protein
MQLHDTCISSKQTTHVDVQHVLFGRPERRYARSDGHQALGLPVTLVLTPAVHGLTCEPVRQPIYICCECIDPKTAVITET